MRRVMAVHSPSNDGRLSTPYVTAIHADMTRKILPKEARIHAIPEAPRLSRGVDARDKRGHDGVVNLDSEPCRRRPMELMRGIPKSTSRDYGELALAGEGAAPYISLRRVCA